MNHSLNKKSNDPRVYLPSFEPRESDLELTAKERSVDRLVRFTLDNVSDEARAVLDFSNMVSEEDKWKQVKEIKRDFIFVEENITTVLKSPLLTERDKKPNPEEIKVLVESLLYYTNILEIELNRNETVNAFGREVVYLLNAMLDVLKNRIDQLVKATEQDPDKIFDAIDKFTQFNNDFFDKLYSGFVTEDTSSAPVQIQLFDNLTKALWIPPYPLADIVSLYDEFNAKKPGDDYSQIMEDRFNEFLEPKKQELEEQIKKEKERALKLKQDFESKINPKFQELLRRYADYWISMTPEKLYEYIIKRRAVENFAEGRINLDQMEDFYKVWAEIANQKPPKITKKIKADFEKHMKDIEIPKGEKSVPPYEKYEVDKN